MTFIWVSLGLAVLVGAVVVVMRSKAAQGAKALPSPSTRTLTNIQVNDIVTHFDRTYMVDGTLTYRDELGERKVYMLVDGDDVLWLSVQEGDRLSVALYREDEDMRLDRAPEATMNHSGVTYELERRGKAEMQSLGATGKPQRATYNTFELHGPGGKRLYVEERSGAFDVLAGQTAKPAEFEILPGDDVE